MSESSEDYDVFVSYYEDTADDYAERIRRVLSDAGYKVFVSHIERPRREGNFEEYVNHAIASSHTFIFINTINSLTRPQVIREFQQSFPNGDLTTRSLWIFKHDMEDVPHGSEEFKNQTNIDLSSENQSPFKSPAELAYSALSRCKKRKLEKSTVNEFVQKDVKLNEEQRKDYSELLHEKLFAKEFEKRGYIAEFQREIGNHLSADLILQKNNEWIICEFKANAEKISTKVFSQLLKYKNEIEIIEPNLSTQLWLIGQGTFSDSIKTESKKYDIKLIDDSNIHEFLEQELVYLSVQGSIISYGGTKKIRFRVDEVKDEPLKLKIKNEKGDVILEEHFTMKSTTWIEHEIVAKGDAWKQPGELFSIIVEYGGKSVLATIWRSNFGAVIELDQKVYTWTDKVYITLVVPDFSHFLTQYVDIATNEDKILNYKLEQTGPDTGIFTGEIRLSGLKKYFSEDKQLRDFLGVTQGTGPTDGLIACGKDDGIQVSFKFTEDEQVIGSALVRWNIGEVQWLDASYPVDGIGKIRVVDPDMNLNPNEIDTVEVKVWSDSDVIKKTVILHETNTNTGIFEGEIKFDPKQSSESILHVANGDTIVAEYIDYTLPDPYNSSDELEISGTATIRETMSPLERFTISNLKFLNENKNEITELTSGKIIYISATIKNNQDKDQKYAFLAQIKEEDNITLLIGVQSGILKANDSKVDFIKWIPEFGGNFLLSTYVRVDADDPSALCPPLDKEITVGGKTAEELGFSKPLFEQRPKVADSKKKEHRVIIPPGSSVPGCEETGECFIPSVLEIGLNEEVIWVNEDTAAHTITSGISETGPDGKFDSSLFMSGNTYSVRFTEKGEYPYFDMVHPWQIGIIIVK